MTGYSLVTTFFACWLLSSHSMGDKDKASTSKDPPADGGAAPVTSAEEIVRIIREAVCAEV